jgi:lipid II:glycine glycyltransferase (peptidoglycan interpeptide bridge formation enzyme)
MPVASVITLAYKETVTYKYGGSDQHFHNLGSMPFVLWKAIQKAQAGGAQSFDLGRSEFHNKGGVTFKDHWDSQRSTLTYRRFSRPAQSAALVQSHRFRLAQSFFGMLPDPLLRLSGELMYRHIG